MIENLGNEKTFAPLAWIYERRQELIVDFKNNFNASTAGILIASLLGNRYFLDKQTAEIFREGGTFHVLVISGLHITFIGGLTLLFVRFFTRKRLWQFLIAGGFLWAYSFAVGADVPVVRATMMFTILLFSQVIYRKGNLLNSLGACALVLLVWRPEDLFSAIVSSDFFERHFDCRVGFSADRKFARNRQLVAFRRKAFSAANFAVFETILRNALLARNGLGNRN